MAFDGPLAPPGLRRPVLPCRRGRPWAVLEEGTHGTGARRTSRPDPGPTARCRRREGPRSRRRRPAAGSGDGRRGVDGRSGCEDGPRKVAETGSRHAARQLGRARPGVPVVHPVASAPWRSHPGAGLGHHRGDRVRAGRRGRLDLACLRRPGPSAAPELGVAGLPGECRRAAGGLVRAGPVLAVRDPAPHGGVGLQPRTRRGFSTRRGCSLLPAHPDRPRPSTRLPVGGTPAEAMDRPSRGSGRGLGACRRPHLAARLRAAARRVRQRRGQGLLGA